jgi:hypothetical protein
MFQNLTTIKEAGFTGFKTVAQLWDDPSTIPNEKGVYMIWNPDCSKKQFMTKGVGGFFKGKDPNLGANDLKANWVDDCHVLYIGQAGGNGSAATLKKRLKQYLDFGKGKPVGHYGGRLIWQLSHHPELIVAWNEEKILIQDFISYYGRLPFANLTL